jgi:ADP-ribosylglycohydrolase
MENSLLTDSMIGLAVADAVGVPYEFKLREELITNQARDMIGFGVHNQPKGTWSDDTSLNLCLIESLTRGLDYIDIMKNFLSWYEDGCFTPWDVAFDIGNGTREAIHNFSSGIAPLQCGGKGELRNGNGSLMRILPILFYIRKYYGTEIDCDEAMEIIHNVSKLTHQHPRSQMACGIYCIIANELINNPDSDLETCIKNGIAKSMAYYLNIPLFQEEAKYFSRIIHPDFKKLPKEIIKSSGYVVDTLEASLWCLMNSSDYRECVLKAVNLGSDTDTVAAVAGGIAGIIYGLEGIPESWKEGLVKKDIITGLCRKFEDSLSK